MQGPTVTGTATPEATQADVSEDTPNAEGTLPAGQPANAGGYSLQYVNEKIQDRLARERQKHKKELEESTRAAIEAWRAEHGLDDEALEKLSRTDESGKELRSLRGQMTRLQNEQKQRDDRIAALLAVVNKTKISDAVYKAAMGKAVDPEDVMLRLHPRLRLTDDFDVAIVDEHGSEIHGKTIDQLVDDLLAAKPHLALPKARPGGSGGFVSHDNAEAAPATSGEKLTPEQRRAAIAEGMRRGLFGGGAG